VRKRCGPGTSAGDVARLQRVLRRRETNAPRDVARIGVIVHGLLFGLPLPPAAMSPATRSLVLALATALVAALVGCGGAAATPDTDAGPVSDGDATSTDADSAGTISTVDGARMIATDGGTLSIEGDVPSDAEWFALVPSRWPDNEGERPHVGLGRLQGVEDEEGRPTADLWVVRQSSGLGELSVVWLDGPEALAGSKLLTTIDSAADGEVLLGAGDAQHVGSGDFFFVVDPTRPAGRLGDAVVGLLRVTDVEDDVSVARVEHGEVDADGPHLALFAQASLDRPTGRATVRIAPATPDSTVEGLPELASALPRYLAEYALTNIAVEGLDTWIDPRPFDAPTRTNEQFADDEGWGTIVFGTLEGDTFIYNTTPFGEGPHPANTVGILPGGLPLAASDGLAALSEQLAPSFIATVLAMRGDHALAVYFLERVMRDVDLVDDVRFHLREHAALRWLALGRNAEAMTLMSEDVDQSRDENLVHPLLNALSIRSLLDSRSGLYDQWIADSEEFLEVADGVLPPESLGYERLNRARALSGRTEDTAEAREVIDDVLAFADEWDDDQLRYLALLELVDAAAMHDDALAPVLFGELEELASTLDEDARISVAIAGAELFAAIDDPARSAEQLETALTAVNGSPSVPLRAAIHRRAANVLRVLGLSTEARMTMQEAVIGCLETGQYEAAAALAMDVGFMQLEEAQRGAGQMDLVLEGHRNLVVATELALRLGNTVEAAQVLGLLGLMEIRFGNSDRGVELLDEALMLARDSAHYQTLYEISEQRALWMLNEGRVDDAHAWRHEARTWAEAGALDVTFEPLEDPASL